MKTGRLTRNLWLSWVGVFAALLAWQLITTLNLINPSIFPGPLQVIQSAVQRVPLPELWTHVSRSLMRVALGFSAGAALGITIGVASGWYRWLGKVVWTPLELLRPIPPLAWISLALIWFGLGEGSKVFIIFLGAFFPMVTNTYKGMTGIDPDLLRVGQTMNLSGAKLLAQIALPAAMPDIATGIRVGWSLSFGSLVAAEMLAAREGLGYLIMNAREQGEISIIVYGILIIGTLNLITDFLIQALVFKRQLKWRFDPQSGH